MNFEALRNVDIESVSLDDLVDIRDVEVDKNLSKEERILDYIRQIKNPYCYKYKDFIVKVEYADTDLTIEDCLAAIIL